MDEQGVKQYKDLITLLRSFVLERAPERTHEPDWNALLPLAQIHGLTGIVTWMITTYDLTENEKLKSFAKQSTKETIVLYVRRWEATKRLLEELSDQKIDHVMFKGFVLRDCYPIPELRSYSDMDLSIHPNDRNRSHVWMMQHGYDVETDWEPVYSYRKGIEHYEFHTDMMEVDVTDRTDYRGYFRSVWDHVENLRGSTYVPKAEFHFLYLLTHIAKHISASGAGIRMYLDLAFFIRKFGADMDWMTVENELRKLQLYEFANTALVAVERWFGTECPMPLHPVEAGIMDEFLSYTLEGGAFGHASRDSGMIALKKEKGAEVSRIATLTHRLFPKASTIERRYTYLQGHHWLLPIAWVHRFFRTWKAWGYHTQEAKVILSAEEEEIKRLKKIQTDIGLG